jgi:hypothetical protein
MKSLSRIGSLCLVACSLTMLATSYPAVAQSSDYDQPGDTPADIDQPSADVSPATFENELAAHGRWIDTPEYGRVWVPDVDEDFQPYATNGHWVVTNYGNTWVSDYSWGWAPFHYGRWYRDSNFGWAWVPGRVWGPAWVSWRSGDGYYGWAPLGPSVSININIPIYAWTYVPQRYIVNRDINNYYIRGSQTVNIHRNTTIVRNNYRIDNRTYVYGPRRQEIETVTNRRVDVYRVDRQNQPGRSTINGSSVSIYRPPASESRRRERATNNINPGQTTETRERRQSTRQESTTPVNPSTRDNYPTERRRSSRQESTTPVTPRTRDNYPTERRRSPRQESTTPVTPSTTDNYPTERRRSSRQESTTSVTPGSRDSYERRRSSRQESTTPVTPSNRDSYPTESRRSYPSQSSGQAPVDNGGRQSGGHGRRYSR